MICNFHPPAVIAKLEIMKKQGASRLLNIRGQVKSRQ
jgi:hypothetical protein